MKDREEIVSAFKQCGLPGACLKCKYGAEREGCYAALRHDVLELLKEQPEQKFFVDSDGKMTPLPIQPQWIGVKDRLPETRHAVLVYTPHHKNIWAASMHEDGNWYIWSPGGKVLLNPDWHGPITHWMPLPEPPKEVKQDET